jgi:hypothetical protein
MVRSNEYLKGFSYGVLSPAKEILQRLKPSLNAYYPVKLVLIPLVTGIFKKTGRESIVIL